MFAQGARVKAPLIGAAIRSLLCAIASYLMR